MPEHGHHYGNEQELVHFHLQQALQSNDRTRNLITICAENHRTCKASVPVLYKRWQVWLRHAGCYCICRPNREICIHSSRHGPDAVRRRDIKPAERTRWIIKQPHVGRRAHYVVTNSARTQTEVSKCGRVPKSLLRAETSCGVIVVPDPSGLGLYLQQQE